MPRFQFVLHRNKVSSPVSEIAQFQDIVEPSFDDPFSYLIEKSLEASTTEAQRRESESDSNRARSRSFLGPSRSSFCRSSSSLSSTSTIPDLIDTDNLSPTSSAPSTPVEKHKIRQWWPSHRQKTQAPPPRINAEIGESIATRYSLDEASIDGEFAHIEYGTHNNRAACMIIVDFRVCYQPSHIIEGAKISFRFGSEEQQQQCRKSLGSASKLNLAPEPRPASMVSKSFSPSELAGPVSVITETQTHAPGIGLNCSGAGAGYKYVKQRVATHRSQWRVQGRQEEHDGVYDSFGWNVMQNAIGEDSVPRNFRVGMIAYAPADLKETAEFYVDISVEGKLRKNFNWGKSKVERRYFQIPGAAKRVLTRQEVEMLVNDANGGLDESATHASSHAEAQEGSPPDPEFKFEAKAEKEPKEEREELKERPDQSKDETVQIAEKLDHGEDKQDDLERMERPDQSKDETVQIAEKLDDREGKQEDLERMEEMAQKDWFDSYI